MKSILTIIFSLIFSLSAYGATYVPLPIESQLETSYGVVEGTFQGSSYKKLPNGAVATIASFHVDKHAGIKTSEIKNNYDFKITLPGGVWDELTYFVSGVPAFKKGERVVLLVSEGRYGTQLHNLGMGKYRVVEQSDSKYLISEVFPQHPKLGRIAYKKFNEQVQAKFGTTLSKYSKDMYVYKKPIKSKGQKTDKLRQRRPASAATNGPDQSPFTPIFLVLVFAAIGAYGAYLVRDK